MILPERPGTDTLLAWWLGELSEADARAVEELIFNDAAWAEAAESLAHTATLVRAAMRQGLVAAPVTTSLLSRLEAEQVSMRHYEAQPDSISFCQASRARYTVLHFRADLGTAPRVDVQVETSTGLSARLEDVPVDRDSGEMTLMWPGEEIRAQPDQTLRFTLYTVAGESRQVLATYTLEHSSRLAD